MNKCYGRITEESELLNFISQNLKWKIVGHLL